MLHRAVKDEIMRLVSIIDAPQDILPCFEKSTYDGLYVDSDYQLNLVIIEQERGRAQIIKSTRDVQEFLFWIFNEVTHTMALSYAFEHNTLPQDSRRISFPKHE